MQEYTGNTIQNLLGNEAPLGAPTRAGSPMDILCEDSETHRHVLQYLVKRLRFSENAMCRMYSRWEASERRVQAYIDLPESERRIKETAGSSGIASGPVKIVVPYIYATISTIVTYYVHTFLGRRPIFQATNFSSQKTVAVQRLESLLQHNADYANFVRVLRNAFLDNEIYGFCAVKALWTQVKNRRRGPAGFENRMVFMGTEIENIDPFMFFPDPRVPMTQLNKKGEFVFWRCTMGLHELLIAEKNGEIQGINKATAAMPKKEVGRRASNRLLSIDANSFGSSGLAQNLGAENAGSAEKYVQIDQGVVQIIPSELGLGESNVPEKWLFSIANEDRIIQAEPFDTMHDELPVYVSEPHSFNYNFGSLSTTDYVDSLQDIMGWLLNTHMGAVEGAINNTFIVDPSRVEMRDFLGNPKGGRIIRLKDSAIGTNPQEVIYQLGINDVTRGHVNDMQTFMQIGDMLSAVTDNLRGIQDSGGRKTATEVRTSIEAASSRLAGTSRLISAQFVSPLGNAVALNYQQHLTPDYYTKIFGEFDEHAFRQLVEDDYIFPVSDGTLPIDRVGLIDAWKEIFIVMSQNQVLSQQYNMGEIFEYLAELSGARDIKRFKIQMASPEAIDKGIQQGSLV